MTRLGVLDYSAPTGATVTMRAANGHTLDYQVIGHYPDGRPRVSQWDAEHSDSCRCSEWDVDDWGDLL